MWFWTAIGLAAAAYCVITGLRLLIVKRYALGVAGVALGVAIPFMPVVGSTHAATIDLPAAAP